MPRHRIIATAKYPAPAGYMHALLADYRAAHPRILPARYIRDFVVEKGGSGAGTAFAFVIAFPGLRRRVRWTVSEPEPGRVIVERDHESGTLTTFTVDPLATGGCRVTIATDITVRPGLRARLAGAIARLLVARVHREELELLRAAASQPAGDDGWSLPLGGLRGASRPVAAGAMQAARATQAA